MLAKSVCLAVGVALSMSFVAFSESSRSILEGFKSPSRTYSSAPLWVWNDLLTEEQVLATLRDLAAQDVKQVFVHPRPGLMTPYLSKDWFALWKAVLREAEVLDMNVWIYDENSYPSGFAGGFVPEAMPESHGLGFTLETATKPAAWAQDTLAVYRISNGKAQNISDTVRSGEALPDGEYVTAAINESKSSPWFGGKYYVDLLRPGVTQKFLEITMDAYKREIGDQFGKRVPGSFTDEPHLAPAGGFHWTPDLPEVMQQRYGYSILDTLPSLSQPVGDWRAVRHDYYQTLLHLFIERWAKPYHDYCAANNLEFTGHYWEHEWPNCRQAPDNMAMYAWHQRPAIDTLFNEYDEGTHAQFGNVRAVLELASAANQSGAKRTLCEAYGGGGWDMRFEDMKRIGDWLYALGVNTLDQHLSYITMRGARKYDYPPSFSYHEPWWDSYHVLGQYFTRLSAVLSSGEPVADILVIEPTTTAWMYQTDADKAKREELGNSFQQLVTYLAQAQVEFDLGSEDIIIRQGAIDKAGLRVGKRVYKTIILPAHMETLDSKTVDLLNAFADAKFSLYTMGEPALQYIDARPSEKAAALLAKAKLVSLGDLVANWVSVKSETRVQVAAQKDSIVYHLRRKLEDGELLFIANTRNDEPATIQIRSHAKSIQEWNLEAGAVEPLSCANPGEITQELPPAGSLLVFLNAAETAPTAIAEEAEQVVTLSDSSQIVRIAPNVLTLDYLDLKIGDKEYPKQYMYAAARLAFQSVGLPEDPWDHAVQFNDELIRMTFPENSGFEATYHFNMRGAIPGVLHAVVERPELYSISCNGVPVAATPGEWWLDRAFGKIDITKAAHEGDNTLTLKASPMTMHHEITAVYILGNFALEPADAGHVIVAPAELKLGAWNTQGCPFYAQGVGYTQHFNVSKPASKYIVALPAWYGSVAKVMVNGELAGHIGWQPAKCDVTKLIKPGENAIEVIVVGTLKNTLGPYFGKERLGFASPHSFRDAPESGPPAATAYNSIGYGLMKPFTLLASAQ
ncbi:MAG: hypothetical protein IT366_20390 [Candidatus Hydrogenedentes bacterium]|nr:hypothetical protein [Candidatus Hydrogenedentota bacterium]